MQKGICFFCRKGSAFLQKEICFFAECEYVKLKNKDLRVPPCFWTPLYQTEERRKFYYIRAGEEYEKRGVITFERSAGSMYSKRMVEAFHSKGMIRLSPLHVNTPDDIDRFLDVTQEIAALY